MGWRAEAATLAEIQHGVVARRQLRAMGVERDAVARDVRKGEWATEGPSVLRRVGAPRTDDQERMVAVLAAGPGALLSHRAAAALWALPGFGGSCAEATVRRTRDDGPAHRPRLLLPHHATDVRGIPCTSLPRTIFDLAADVRLGRMERLVDTVIARSPAVLPSLHQMLDELAERGRPGIRVMRQVLRDRPPGIIPITGLERRFEQLLRNGGEPPLVRQVDAGGHSWIGRVDYLDPVTLLIVEVDSALHHTSPGDRARDAARDAALLAAGYRKVLRITEESIWYEPWSVAPAVREARRELLLAMAS